MKAKYKEPGTLKTAIESYFIYCEEKKETPSKAGIADELDVSDQWLLTHQDKKKYPDHHGAIKSAYRKIERGWIQLLATGKPVGAIFYLKNAYASKYKDKQEHEHRTPEPIQFKVTIHHAQRTESDPGIRGDVPST